MDTDLQPRTATRPDELWQAGRELASRTFDVGAGEVADYVNATGDGAFRRFAHGVRLRDGYGIAPLTMMDRDLGTRLLGPQSTLSVHAKQSFRFHAPARVGERYEISGAISRTEEKRGIQYVTVESAARPARGGQPLIESVYTRAHGFSGGRYGRPSQRRALTLGDWLARGAERAADSANGAGPATVVELGSRTFSKAQANLFSGPDANIHTDAFLARAQGFPAAVAQGLMVTAWECALYRDLVGLDLYRGSELDISYVAPIPLSVTLRVVCEMTAADGREVDLRSAVCTPQDHVVSVSHLRVAEISGDHRREKEQ